jgi:rare lipoprotein A
MTRKIAFGFFLLGLASFGACRRLPETGFFQQGKASFYSDKFHGRPTASGERYDKKALTAAHPHLAFGSQVEVTHLKTKQKVVVRINDRGPFAKGRIIDLSRAAAEQLGMIRDGVAEVQIRLLGKPTT